MALDAMKLVEKMDEKATLLLGQPYITNSSEMKEKLFKVLAESIIEHIQEYAEVKVIIVGSDGGNALLSSNLSTDIVERGDTLIPDIALNAAIASVVSTGNIPTSFTLLNSGFVK